MIAIGVTLEFSWSDVNVRFEMAEIGRNFLKTLVFVERIMVSVK